MVVGRVGVDLLGAAAPAASRGPNRGEVVQQRLEHQVVVGVGRGHQQRQRQPGASAARCSLQPGLARSTGFAPVRSPPCRPQAEGIHADPGPVGCPASPSSSSSSWWSCSNTPARAHSAKRRQQVVTLPQPNSPTGSSAQGGGGASHEQDRSHAGPIRHRAGRAAARVGGWRWQQGAESAATADRAAGGRPRRHNVVVLSPTSPAPASSPNRCCRWRGEQVEPVLRCCLAIALMVLVAGCVGSSIDDPGPRRSSSCRSRRAGPARPLPTRS